MINYLELRKLLAQDKLSKVVDVLQATTARLDTDLNNQVVSTAGRLTRVTNQLNTGQINHEAANQERSRISAALLDIINQLEAGYPETRQPTAQQPQQHRIWQPTQASQSRPVWPYVLLGIVGSIVVLTIIGNLGNGDTGTMPSTLTPSDQPSVTNGGGSATKLTDEPSAPAPASKKSVEYTAADLVGTWTASYSEDGAQLVVRVIFNGDGTILVGTSLNGVLLHSDSGTWQLVGNILHQNMITTGTNSSSIQWVNRNQFENVEGTITLVYNREQ